MMGHKIYQVHVQVQSSLLLYAGLKNSYLISQFFNDCPMTKCRLPIKYCNSSLQKLNYKNIGCGLPTIKPLTNVRFLG